MPRKRISTFRLTVSHFKILATVSELNAKQYYPTAKGVNRILGGSPDAETKQYQDITTYGTLISFPGRKLCSYILNMVRRGYLTYQFDEKTEGMYLKITIKGEEELEHFYKKHKNSFRQKTPIVHPEIVKIV